MPQCHNSLQGKNVYNVPFHWGESVRLKWSSAGLWLEGTGLLSGLSTWRDEVGSLTPTDHHLTITHSQVTPVSWFGG